MARPENITDEHLEFLDDLRESGETNMIGASSYVAEEFEMDKHEAREVCKYWRNTFGQEDR